MSGDKYRQRVVPMPGSFLISLNQIHRDIMTTKKLDERIEKHTHTMPDGKVMEGTTHTAKEQKEMLNPPQGNREIKTIDGVDTQLMYNPESERIVRN